MGVNTLAFRAPHHGAFYAADPDCVPVTRAVPWALTREWLELVAGSGTMLFVSLATDATGAEQRAAVRTALARAAAPQPLAEPLDWMDTTVPSRWRLGRRTASFRWMPEAGVETP